MKGRKEVEGRQYLRNRLLPSERKREKRGRKRGRESGEGRRERGKDGGKFDWQGTIIYFHPQRKFYTGGEKVY